MQDQDWGHSLEFLGHPTSNPTSNPTSKSLEIIGLRKVPLAHALLAQCTNLVGNTQKQQFFLQIFLVNPNFLLAHRNTWYSEGTDCRQMTPCGYPNFNSYIENLHFLVFPTDRGTDGWTDGQRD